MLTFFLSHFERIRRFFSELLRAKLRYFRQRCSVLGSLKCITVLRSTLLLRHSVSIGGQMRLVGAKTKILVDLCSLQLGISCESRIAHLFMVFESWKIRERRRRSLKVQCYWLLCSCQFRDTPANNIRFRNGCAPIMCKQFCCNLTKNHTSQLTFNSELFAFPTCNSQFWLYSRQLTHFGEFLPTVQLTCHLPLHPPALNST